VPEGSFKSGNAFERLFKIIYRGNKSVHAWKFIYCGSHIGVFVLITGQLQLWQKKTDLQTPDTYDIF